MPNAGNISNGFRDFVTSRPISWVAFSFLGVSVL